MPSPLRTIALIVLVHANLHVSGQTTEDDDYSVPPIAIEQGGNSLQILHVPAQVYSGDGQITITVTWSVITAVTSPLVMRTSFKHGTEGYGSSTVAIGLSGTRDFVVTFPGNKVPPAMSGYKVLAYITPEDDPTWGSRLANQALIATTVTDVAITSTVATTTTVTPMVLATAASDLSVESNGQLNTDAVATWLELAGGAVATGCSGTPPSWSTGVVPNWMPGTCDGQQTLTVTFTATDTCSQTLQTTATFTIIDSTAPEITIPAATLHVVERTAGTRTGVGQQLSLVASTEHGGAEATDMASPVTWSWSSSTSTTMTDPEQLLVLTGVDGCPDYDATVAFHATDSCDNVATTVGGFAFRDTAAPIFQTPPSALEMYFDTENNPTAIESWVQLFGHAIVVDVASGSVNSTMAPLRIDILSDDYAIGGYQFAIVQDSTDISATFAVTATDACGNSATAEATVTIRNARRTLSEAPSDMTIEADGGDHGGTAFTAWLDSNAGATLDPSMDATTTVWSHTVSSVGFVKIDATSTCQADYIDVVFTVTHPAWLQPITSSARFTVVDTTTPSIALAASDMRADVDALGGWLESHGGAIAHDLITHDDRLIWSHSEPTFSNVESNGNCVERRATILFTATDECGNAVTTSAVFEALDRSSPSVSLTVLPTAMTVDLSVATNDAILEQWLASAAGALTDIQVTWAHSTPQFTSVESTSCATQKANVTFTATDVCEHQVVAVAQFSRVDRAPPQFTRSPGSTTGEDDGTDMAPLSAWLDANGNADAVDALSGEVVWTHTVSGPFEIIDASNGCRDRLQSVIFTASDQCGNSASQNGTFFIRDREPPTFSALPMARTTELTSATDTGLVALNGWLSTFAGAAVDDARSSVTLTRQADATVATSLHLDRPACLSTQRTVHFVATDACGNTADQSAVFALVDSTPPTITAEATALTVESDGQGNSRAIQDWLALHGGASATDAISAAVAWTYSPQTPAFTLQSLTGYLRANITFFATDDCGNAAEVHSTILVEDTSGPRLLAPARDVRVEIGSAAAWQSYETWLNASASASAADVGLADPQCAEAIARTRRTTIKFGADVPHRTRRQTTCFCNDFDQSVCGSDDVTYQNPCWAFCFEIFTYTEGACETTEQAPTTSSPSLAPSMGTSGPSTSPSESPSVPPTDATVDPNCTDSRSSCVSWAENGFCAEDGPYFAYMRLNCIAACGFCEGSISQTAAPSAPPSTAVPTTPSPTTASPTTASPTTAAPTTATPTTAVPTTVAPTTAAPTTVAPTTVQPTTAQPTTAQPSAAPVQGPQIAVLRSTFDVALGQSSLNFSVRFESSLQEPVVIRTFLRYEDNSDIQNEQTTSQSGSGEIDVTFAIDAATFQPGERYKILTYFAAANGASWSTRLANDVQWVSIMTTTSTVSSATSVTETDTTSTATTTVTTVTETTATATTATATSTTFASEIFLLASYPTYLGTDTTHIDFSVRYRTQGRPAQLRASFRELESRDMYMVQPNNLVPDDEGIIQFSQAVTAALVPGEYVLLTYLVPENGVWDSRYGQATTRVIVSDESTPAPTDAPTEIPTAAPVTTAPISGMPTTTAPTTAAPVISVPTTPEANSNPTTISPTNGCTVAAIEQFIEFPQIRMTKARKNIIATFVTNTAAECANHCVEEGDNCVAFEYRNSNLMCNLKSVNFHMVDITHTSNENWNTYVRSIYVARCPDDNNISSTEEPITPDPVETTVMPVDTTSNTPPCADTFLNLFTRHPEVRQKNPRKYIIEEKLADLEGCAKACFELGSVCKSFETRPSSGTCTLRTVDIADVGFKINDRYDTYDIATRCGADTTTGLPITRDVISTPAVPITTSTLATTGSGPSTTDGLVNDIPTTAETTEGVSTTASFICACNDDLRTPVCADGQTYHNPCYAFCHNNYIFTFGACNESSTPTPLTTLSPVFTTESEPPSTTAANNCFCDLSLYAPVCSNGKTYHSICFAFCDNSYSTTAGACPTTITETTEPRTTASTTTTITETSETTVTTVTTTTATSTSATTNTATSVTATETATTVTATTVTASTTTPHGVRCFCENVYEPVCARDKSNYANPCFAACHGDFEYTLGACADCGDLTWTHDPSPIESLEEIMAKTCAERHVDINFAASDRSGNSVQTSARLTFVDSVPPVITRNALDVDFESGAAEVAVAHEAWLQLHGGADATDDTSSDLEWHHIDSGMAARTNTECTDLQGSVEFVVSDDCGNQASTTAVVTFQDRTAPQFMTYALNKQVQLSSNSHVELEAWVSNRGGAVAEDSVSSELKWSSSVPTVIEVERLSLPTTVISGSGSGEDQYGNVCLNRTSYITFTVSDDCENSNSTIAAFSVTDTAPPVLVQPAQSLTIDSTDTTHHEQLNSWLASNANIEVTDAGSPAESLVWTSVVQDPIDLDGSGPCSDTSVHTVFTIEDECRNSVSSTAEFVRKDLSVPTMQTRAESLVVESDGAGNMAELAAWIALHGHATAIDNIDAPTNLQWSHAMDASVRDFPDTADLSGSTSVTFSVSDSCKNTNSSTAQFVIRDTTAPTITIEANSLTVEANADTNTGDLERWLNSSGEAAAADSSASIIWSYEDLVREQMRLEDMASECRNEEITVTFIATDPSNNRASTEAVLTIVDRTAPQIVRPPQNVMLGALGGNDTQAAVNSWLANVGDALASDVRGIEVWSNDVTDEPGFSLHDTTSFCTNRSAVVRFTVGDACGNANSALATITVYDTVAPLFSADAQDAMVLSDGAGNAADLETWLSNHGGATATDNDIGDIVWTHSAPTFAEVIVGDGCTDRSTTVRFTATDSCGNSAMTTAVFSIVDSEPPTVIVPATNMSVLPDDGMVSIVDGAIVSGDNNNSRILESWLSAHGRSVVHDTVSGTDLMRTYTLGAFQAVVPGSTCADEFIEVTFVATDHCGHTAITTGRFAIMDASWPEITTAAVSGSAEMNSAQQENMLNVWLSRSGNAVAVDGGSEEGITWSQSPLNFSRLDNRTECTDLVGTVTFTASDSCGNTASTTAEYTLVDTSPPVISSVAQSQIFEHDSTTDNADDIQGWLNTHGGAVASDSTSATLVWSYSKPLDWVNEHSGCANRQASVVFSVADLCGNMISTTAVVAVVDTEVPVVTTPAQNLTVQADGFGNVIDLQLWLQSQGDAVTSKPVLWTFEAPIFSDVSCAGRSTRVNFHASDACGQTTSTTGHFHIVDVPSPTFESEAQDLTVEADWTDNAADLQAWLDVQGGAVLQTVEGAETTWTFTVADAVNDGINGSMQCTTAKHRVATFTATNQCGQSATTTATFAIRDTVAPTVGCNAKFEIRCDQRCQLNTAFDEFLTYDGHLCIADVSSYSVAHNFPTSQYQNFDMDICGTSGTVRFTITDTCGNVHDEIIEYTVTEDTPSCPACIAGEVPSELSTIDFMWMPGMTAGTVASISADAGATLVGNTSAVSRGAIITMTVTAGITELTLAVDATETVIDIACSGNLAVGTDVQFGPAGLVGALRVVGFSRSDGTSSDACGDMKKCDPGLCLDIDACTDGAFSIVQLTMMYVGYNPTILSSDLYSQPEGSVSIDGDPAGKSPVMMYFSKFADQMFPGVDLNNVRIGQELEMHRFWKNPTDLAPRFTGFVNARIDSASEKVKFMTSCRDNNGLRVGDRFGSLLVTGYKSNRGKQCHVNYNIDDFTPDQSAGLSGSAAQGSVGDSMDGVAFAVLGIGVAMVALVVIIAAVVLNRRSRDGNFMWDDASSENSARTAQSGLGGHPTMNPTAMDLINSHHFSDVGSIVDTMSEDSAFGVGFRLDSTVSIGAQGKNLEWDDSTLIGNFSEPALSARNHSVVDSDYSFSAMSSARPSHVESVNFSNESGSVVVAMDSV